MAYNLTYSGNQTGGNTVITVPDGSFTSIGNIALPGRNFNGYGAPVDQSLLSMLENFASSTSGPSQAITGQIWYDVGSSTLKYNTSSNIANLAEPTWASIPQLDPNGNVSFGNITMVGNLTVDPPGVITGNGSGLRSLNASNLSTGTVPVGRMSGTYNIDVTGNLTGNVTGNSVTANFFVGGNVAATKVVTSVIDAGSAITPGTITGQWSLTAGSRLTATYADLAERHHSDTVYPVGTVMTVGGVNEVTAATNGDRILGVVSTEYAFLMNGEAGNDNTHPAVAYLGRVPVRVVGPINKHDPIALDSNSHGVAKASAIPIDSFGWALETNTDSAEKLVLCIIK